MLKIYRAWKCTASHQPEKIQAELLICKGRPLLSDICDIFTTNICLLECSRPLHQMLAPAQSIFTDGVERALTRETVEVPLVLGGSLQRIFLTETHKRLAPLPRPLAPVAKSCSTLKILENLLIGKGRFFSSCLALLARVSSLNCSSVFTTSTILSTLLTLSTDSQKLLKSHSHVRPHTQEPSRYWAATTLG